MLMQKHSVNICIGRQNTNQDLLLCFCKVNPMCYDILHFMDYKKLDTEINIVACPLAFNVIVKTVMQSNTF